MGKSRKRGGPPPQVKAKAKTAAVKAKKPAPAAPKKAPGSQTVLHIGWSTAVPERLHKAFRTPEWKSVRVDMDPSTKPDIEALFTEMKDVETASMDAVFCPHMLQRFFPKDAEKGLRECFRVLKEGGFLMVSLPDGQLAATFLANNKVEEAVYQSPVGGITALDMLYGYGPSIQAGKFHFAHRTAFTAESLGLLLRNVGFTNIRVQRDRGGDISAVGHKFRFDHPYRVERLSITTTPAATVSSPPVPAAPQVVAKAAPAAAKPNPQSDWLESAPVEWKPLGLKKK